MSTQHIDDTPPPAPIVSTADGRRRLEFIEGDIQSEMQLDAPNALTLAYTRAMMAFVLFQPQPRHIVIVGLGGGSLVKFCYHHFPHARITVLEIRADVIALREHFLVPPDDARLTVVHCDATCWVATARPDADVILLDGFDAEGLPPPLASSGFYRACRSLLRPGGVLVANIFSYDPDYVAALQRLRQCFGGQCVRLAGIAGNNEIIFAVRTPAVPQAAALLAHMARTDGFGWGWSNRLLARAVVWWLARRKQ